MGTPKRIFSTSCCIAFVCLACFTSMGADCIQERDWTFKTRWGAVGLYQLSYRGSEDSIGGARAGLLQLCGGPLGNLNLSIDRATHVSQWRTMAPILFAIGMSAVVAWMRRQDRKTGSSSPGGGEDLA